MKITIDTSSTPHRVEIEGDCTIGELIEFMSKYYGDFTWKDVKIAGIKVIYNTFGGTGATPYIQPFTTQPWPTIGGGTTPYTIGDFPGTVTFCSDTNTLTTSQGVFELPK